MMIEIRITPPYPINCSLCGSTFKEKYLEIKISNGYYSDVCRKCTKQLAVFLEDHKSEIQTM